MEDYHRVADWICANLQPKSLIDIGCGNAYLLHWMKDQQVRLAGIENATAAFDFIPEAVRPFVMDADLRLPLPPDGPKFDTAVCIEVAEHIEAQHAERILRNIDTLCEPSASLVFSAAIPGQPGTNHINLREHEYWISFLRRIGGWQFNERMTTRMRFELSDLLWLRWIPMNAMVFYRGVP